MKNLIFISFISIEIKTFCILLLEIVCFLCGQNFCQLRWINEKRYMYPWNFVTPSYLNSGLAHDYQFKNVAFQGYCCPNDGYI